MRRIGLLGGMSWESTAVYYRLLNEEVRARLGGLHSADCIVRSLDFEPVERMQRAGRWDEAGQLLAAEAVQARVGRDQRLDAAGDDVLHLALVPVAGVGDHRCGESAPARASSCSVASAIGLASSSLWLVNMVRMSHPDPHGPPDLTPIQAGEVWENPVTGERVTILELPYTNPEGRATAELTALVGARVAGEHRHPALVERFTVLEGELTLKLDGQTSILREGESAVIEAGAWHDWWNASDRDARARVEITPGERFAHMIETLYGLARLGHTNAKGMPPPLQLALVAREFSDVIVFRSPPLAVQRVLFGVLAPIARWRGYRATYPQLSRTVLAPRT